MRPLSDEFYSSMTDEELPPPPPWRCSSRWKKQKTADQEDPLFQTRTTSTSSNSSNSNSSNHSSLRNFTIASIELDSNRLKRFRFELESIPSIAFQNVRFSDPQTVIDLFVQYLAKNQNLQHLSFVSSWVVNDNGNHTLSLLRGLAGDGIVPLSLWPFVLERVNRLLDESSSSSSSSEYNTKDTEPWAPRATAMYQLLHGPALLSRCR